MAERDKGFGASQGHCGHRAVWCLLLMVFTGSGVASAKQTGHCGLSNCGLAATICSECSVVSLHLFTPARLEVQLFF